MDVATLWKILAGLGLFLFGMFMLEEALKNIAGRSFKTFLRNNTNTPIKATLSGALTTAVLQSSSLVSLLVMSFSGAGIIGLKNGIGMIMGSNIGTTITGWIVSVIGFKLDFAKYLLPFIAIGGLGIIFLKNEKLNHLSKLIMGFSFMFWGLNFMKEASGTFAQSFNLSVISNQPLVVFFITGFIITAAIQSSSAAMVIFLTALSSQIITINMAVALAIGSDMGTTVTALLGTLGANVVKKKVGFFHFLFNAIAAILALLTMNALLWFILNILNITDSLYTVVAFHSLLNILSVIIMLPFVGKFEQLLTRFVKDKTNIQSKFLANVHPTESVSAVTALQKESSEIFNKALNELKEVCVVNPPTLSIVLEKYNKLKTYEEEIIHFYTKLEQANLTAVEVFKINLLTGTVRNGVLAVKDFKDVWHNFLWLHNNTNEPLQQLKLALINFQESFYQIIANTQTSSNNNQEDIAHLKTITKTFYQNHIAELYALLANGKVKQTDVTSVFNLLREINNSNLSLVRSIKYLLAK